MKICASLAVVLANYRRCAKASRYFMSKYGFVVLFAVLVLVSITAIGCSGKSSNSNPDPSSLTGQWEITVPNVDANGQSSTTYLELFLVQSGSEVTVSEGWAFTLPALANPDPVSRGDVGGFCEVAEGSDLHPLQLSGTTLSGILPISCDSSATFTGTVVNNSSITGTYASVISASGASGEPGSFSGQTTTALAGSYSGTLTFLDGTQENVSVSLSESPGPAATLTVSGTVTGQDAGSLNLSGLGDGNAASVAGVTPVNSNIGGWLVWYHANSLYIVSNVTADDFYYGQLEQSGQ